RSMQFFSTRSYWAPDEGRFQLAQRGEPGDPAERARRQRAADVGHLETLLWRRLLQQSVNEPGIEAVARTGGVDIGHRERVAAKFLVTPKQSGAFAAELERDGGHALVVHRA